jgi:hypothetical protein
METTMISNEAYAKIVNLLKTFYLQGFEDAANCPEPVDMSKDIEKQLDIVGIQCNDSLWIQHLDARDESVWGECVECGEYNGIHDPRCSWMTKGDE